MTTEKPGPVGGWGYDDGFVSYDGHFPSGPLVVCPITPDGSVGGLTQEMLEALEMAIRWAVDELDVSYLADLLLLKDAIQAILDQVKEPTP